MPEKKATNEIKKVLAELQVKINDCLLAEQAALAKRLGKIRKRLQQKQPADKAIANLQQALTTAIMRQQQRQQQCPVPDYPLDLPVVARREEIRKAIAAHQVVIICGETGSGKTTQLPKICLELGRGVQGMIGHTQPRRIAARSLAARIAEELHSEVGQAVGYKVRFTDQVGDGTFIKVMTDGILLAETQSDPMLLAYDTIIIDEAHERSLNIDFILGYLSRLLPKRPDLKVIITSATIEPERFAKHFNNAPIVEVSGRTYPVEIRYRPIVDVDKNNKNRDQNQALLDAVDELIKQGPGDILVFLAGERDIREAAEALRKRQLRQTDILPLYGRLSAEQQNTIFRTHKNRRIVLATNVAETSLTVPGIHYVIDTGLARISRYSYRTKVQRLPIEPVSQASANQRAGRCGRTGPGICIRLYSEEDYLQRTEFTEPEILRTNLASVILQMLSLKLGDIESFPFVEAPDMRLINDGFKVLYELNAIDTNNQLTTIGRQLARLPIDVRLGRMLLAAHKEGCLREVLIITSALSIQDPRDRPSEVRQVADQKHAQFSDKQSDFIAYLNLWAFYQSQKQSLSQNRLRKLCQTNFLSYMRMREWSEIYLQLKTVCKQLGFSLSGMQAVEGQRKKQVNKSNAQQSADRQWNYPAIHRALLTGLLNNIAFKADDKEYSGARNIKLNIFPASGLYKKSPKWIVAAELIETAKRYAHTVAKIDPQWAEELGQHLLKRHYFDPHWEKRRGHVTAYEQVTLYGLILVARRKVDYGNINRKQSREIFILEALVREEFLYIPSKKGKRLDFLKHNKKVKADVLELEAKSRRQDVLAEEQDLYALFDQYVPEDIASTAAFEKWYSKADEKTQQAFYLNRQQLMQHDANAVTDSRFPATLNINGLLIPLQYHFEPSHPDDGVTAKLPLAALNQINPHYFEWLIPGLFEEKVTLLIKSLPKALRRNFVPAPEYAKACVEAITPQAAPLIEKLAEQLQRMSGMDVPRAAGDAAWQPQQLPQHLFMNFHIVRPDGKVLAKGRDLNKLKEELSFSASSSFEGLPTEQYERSNIQAWDFGDLAEFVEIQQHGLTLRAYPALCVEQKKVHLRLLDAQDKSQVMHHEGVLALFQLKAQKNIRYLEKNIPNIDKLCLHYAPIGQCEHFKQDFVRAVTEIALFSKQLTIREQQVFHMESDWAEKQLLQVANDMSEKISAALQAHHKVRKRLKGNIAPQWLSALGDIQEQLSSLVYPGFITQTPYHQLKHLERYLQAIGFRLDKLEKNPARDKELSAQVKSLWQQYQQKHTQQLKKGFINEALQHYRWMIEEFRVSLYAQELGTAEPVSAKRLQNLWQAID